MDWLTLGLVLLAVASNIQAQEGYNYPRPKTPFPSGNVNLISGSRPDGADDSNQKPFGTQQPDSQRPFGGFQQRPSTPSGGPDTFRTNQPSGTPDGSQTTYGSQPSGGYSSTSPSGTFGTTQGTSFGIQRPFGGQQPSGGLSDSTQRPFGTQQPFSTQTGRQFGTQGTPGQQIGTSGQFGSQQPSTSYPGQSGRAEAGRRVDSQPSEGGLPGGQREGVTRPGRVEFASVNGATTGSEPSGYRYPSPQQQFSDTEQSRGTFGSGRRPSTSAGAETPAGETRFPGSTQFAPERPLGSQNGKSDGSERPSFAGGQGARGYPEIGRPQGPATAQYPSRINAGQRQEIGGNIPTGYTGSQDYRISSDEVSQSSGRLGGGLTPSISRFPSDGLSQTSVPSQQRPISAGRTLQFPSSGVQQQTEPINGQRTTGYHSTSTAQDTATVGRPSRPQYPSGVSTTSKDKPSTGAYQSYLPPEQPGTGGLPLADVPSSRFPSDDFTQTDSRQRSGYGSTGGLQRPTGAVGQPTRLQSGYGRSRVTSDTQDGADTSAQPQTGQFSRPDTQAGSQDLSGTTATPSQSQTGYGRPDASAGVQRPSGASVQQTQNGYGRPEVSTTSQDSFGVTGQPIQPQSNTFNRPDISTDSQRISGVSPQPSQPQNGYGRPGTTSGLQRPSGVPDQPAQTQNGYGRPSTESQTSSGAAEQPTQSQNGFGVTQVPAGATDGRKPTGSQTLSGYQQPADSQNRFDGSGSRFTAGQPTQSQIGVGVIQLPTGAIDGRKPSGSQPPSSGYQQPADSQNRFDGSGSRFPSGQPSTTTIGQPQDESVGIGGRRPFGSQSPSTDRQAESGAVTNEFGKPTSTSQEPSRPGTAGDKAEPGYGLDKAIGEGIPRRTGGRTLPGFQKDSLNFIPTGQREYYPEDESNYEEEDEGDFSAIPGQPGRDYPILSDVPETSFTCDDQEFRGYYADVETRCQIFHICANNRTYDFICPNGTIFHQENLVCVWWNQFDCETAPSLYRINEHIYDYSIFGSQQTGGIPLPGQEYPEFERSGQQGLPSGPTTGVFGQGGTSGTGQGSAYSQYPNQRPLSPSTDNVRYPGEGSQTPTTSGYSSGTRPGSEAYQGPSGAVQSTTLGGFPSTRPQQGVTAGVTGYPSKTPQGAGTYQTPGGASQEGGNGLKQPVGAQRPEQYQGAGGYQGRGGVVQRPGSEAYQRPSGAVQSTTLGGFPSTRSQQGITTPDVTGSQETGNGLQQPVGAQRTGQYQGPGGYQGLGGVGQRHGQETQRYSSDTGRQQTQSFPGASGVSLDERPGQFGRGGKSRPFPPAGQQPEDASRPQGSEEYPTGTSPRTTGQGSPFPGSPQPHQPTREYLPPV